MLNSQRNYISYGRYWLVGFRKGQWVFSNTKIAAGEVLKEYKTSANKNVILLSGSGEDVILDRLMFRPALKNIIRLHD